MKTIYDFIFCDSCLTAETVIYKVKVGTGRTEKTAAQWLANLAKDSNDYLFAIHDREMQHFLDRIVESIFPGENPWKFVRQKMVPVGQIVRFLKNNPACFLNSSPCKV